MTITPTFMLILLAALAGTVVILAVALIWLARRQAKLKNDYEDQADFIHTLNNEFRDLLNVTRMMDGRLQTVGERMIATDLRLNALDGQIGQLAEKLNDVQHSEPTNHPYGQAIQQVRRGASVSELMQTAGLSQDEAALLIRLHGSKGP